MKAAGYHLRMTRDLDAAKDYFHVRYAEAPDARYGLVASSRDKILQGHGVKVLGVGDRHSAHSPGALLPSNPRGDCRHRRRSVLPNRRCRVGDELPAPIEGQALIYATADGAVRVEVLFQDETFWLSQRGMAELFGVDVRTVSEHLQTIFRTGELIEESVVRKFRITAADGKRYLTNLYNLDAVISVGYRVNSRQATQFRIWATQTLKEFIVKGFVLDDERLKQGARFGQDYFDELLGRIREIRASEKRFYQKVRDLYATAIDYDPHSDAAQLFFKKAQNKMLWAVTGKTAAEIVVERAESTQPNMGLKTWAGERVRRQDIVVAKNYLQGEELEELDRIVVMYLDYAEDQVRMRNTMTMRDWEDRLDVFLTFNERELLTHPGTVSAAVAERLAAERYAVFDARRKQFERDDADAEDLKAIEALQRELPDETQGDA